MTFPNFLQNPMPFCTLEELLKRGLRRPFLSLPHLLCCDPFLSVPHRKRKRAFAFCSVIFVDSERLYPYLQVCSIIARECPLHYCRAWRSFQKLLHQSMSSLEASASTYRTSTCQHPLHHQQSPPSPLAVDPGYPSLSIPHRVVCLDSLPVTETSLQ